MTAPAFPTLSKNPSSILPRPLDNTIKTGQEAGLPITRRRWTRTLYEFEVEYYGVTEADIESLFDITSGFYSTVECHTIFTWENYLDSTTYNVRFKSPVEYVRDVRNYRSIGVKFTLEMA